MSEDAVDKSAPDVDVEAFEVSPGMAEAMSMVAQCAIREVASLPVGELGSSNRASMIFDRAKEMIVAMRGGAEG